MVTFDKLFNMLRRQRRKKGDLLAVISSATLAKLDKDGIVTTATISALCQYLDCQPGDIMEYLPDRKDER